MSSFYSGAKRKTIKNAYASGLRRCPCCNIQLVWKDARQGKVSQRNLATIDHIVPKSIGGSHNQENMYIMCRACNEERGTDNFIVFLIASGVSKTLAEDLFNRAVMITIQTKIFAQFTTGGAYSDTREALDKKRRNINSIIQLHREYYGDYLPQFAILQQFVQPQGKPHDNQ